MSSIHVQETVGQVVARHPWLSREFEAVGIDYCCGGKKTLEAACRQQGLDPGAFVARLEAVGPIGGEPVVDASAMSLTDLADHVERTHHAYLRDELPRLTALAEKVASVHGGDDPRLREVLETVRALSAELGSHMMKEEQILFPMIRRLEASDTLPAFHCGSIANPIRQMEFEHDDAGGALERLRVLTDGHVPPATACNTYRALLDGLARLERDMHQHVHKENNVLFPRAAALESERAAGGRT